MRPGWRWSDLVEGCAPRIQWQHGATFGEGPGPWLRVTAITGTAAYNWFRMYICAETGAKCSTSGVCYDRAVAMACAEVRIAGDDDASPVMAGQVRVVIIGADSWRVDGYCDSPEYTGWHAGLDRGEARDSSAAEEAGRLAAARILLAEVTP